MIARVLTDVAGVAKEFDYLVPAGVATDVGVGTQVRIDLAGRRVGGWVVAVGVEATSGMALRSLAKVRGWGPEPAVLELAGWAAWRWAGRRGAFLTTASAVGAVVNLPAPRLAAPGPPAAEFIAIGALANLPRDRPMTLRVPPALDTTPIVAQMAQRGPTLVVVPSVERAAVLAHRLRRAGGDVAVVPHDWAQARAGAAVVVGSRGAAWAPCPGLAAVVVVDGHDEDLGQHPAPTWHAVPVIAERARRAGVPCLILSPCPTVELLAIGPQWWPERTVERRGWAPLEIVDRRHDDPRLGLYSDRLVAMLRSQERAVCVLNRTGRARLLACAACGDLACCERCGAAVAQQSTGQAPFPLICGKCLLVRPQVCATCGSTVLRHLRVGVSRVREEVEALTGRTVGEVTGSTVELPDADVLVGTTAVLHRAGPTDAVAFLEFDQELLAPRVRAAAESLALLASASRLVGGRRGRVLVQTRLPHHPTVQAALLADPSLASDADMQIRRSLQLPPLRAVAVVSGPTAAEYVADLSALPASPVQVLGPDEDRWLVKAANATVLADALAAVPRPTGRLRVAVDPARL